MIQIKAAGVIFFEARLNLNKVAYPQDTRFAKNALVIAPGLTVKSRLAVLEPSVLKQRTR